jgi:hypothetical protein
MRLEAASYRHVYLGHPLTLDKGQVDQLEDRYLGMVEASGSNPDLSILMNFPIAMISGSSMAKGIFWACQKGASWFMR